MKIDYALTLCNEEEEIKKLIPFLLKHKRSEDEIYILLDKPKCSFSLLEYLYELSSSNIITLKESAFNGNFADWKNELIGMVNGDYIFNIDPDEIPHEYLITNLHLLLEQNPTIDLFMVPRINTVEGISEDHLKNWRWSINKNNWINFPDFQSRIFKRSDNIKWEGKVHEKIMGVKNYTFLPELEHWCLYHPKTIEKQEKQNKFYESI